MKDKRLVIGAIAVFLVIIAGIVIFAKPKAAKPVAVAPAVPVKGGKTAPAAPAKKVFAKDMGGLTVKILGSKNRPTSVRVRVFKTIDSKSSMLAAAFYTGKMQELMPGTYDVEVETIPAMIYKGISVQDGRETVQDLGAVTGSINVKAVSAAKKAASYPVRIVHPKSNMAVAAGSSSRPIEVVAGIYDIEVGTIPRQIKKGVSLEAGKEVSIDAGASGSLIVKAKDAAGKDIRGAARIKSENGELVASPAINKPSDVLPGLYIVELAAYPQQSKSDVKVISGEETVVEFALEAPSAPAVKPAAPKPAVPVNKPGV